ncbi:hypothetical protein BDY17DRAFT_229786, partial [Neohortaea acidophila]
SNVLGTLCTFLLPPSIIATLLLYLYAPLLNCGFNHAKPAEAGCMIPGQERPAVKAQIAPFRLLTFADPQLEGDSSLPDAGGDSFFPSLENFWTDVRERGIAAVPGGVVTAATGLLTHDLLYILQWYRKRLDLWGNDLYLRHVYRSVTYWSDPTHMVILGDLLGSQHISDAEFQRRSRRFWTGVFKGSKRVPRTITDVSGRAETLGKDADWKNRIIAVAGNHDIGYAGDITEHRVQRFEETYGAVNWDIRFRLDNGTASDSPKKSLFSAFQFGPAPPELHVVVLNSMNLDSPAKDLDLQSQSRDFASEQLHGSGATRPKNSATLLLTHIPLYKPAGLCTDAEYFDWLPADEGGGLKEQNLLSLSTSMHILDGLAKSGKALVLNGHDHAGCDTFHYKYRQPASESEAEWTVDNYPPFNYPPYRPPPEYYLNPNREPPPEPPHPDTLLAIREITVRSMMGSYWGNAGFVSGWFDYEEEQWKFDYNTCFLGVQHIWWGIHVLDLVTLGLGV